MIVSLLTAHHGHARGWLHRWGGRKSRSGGGAPATQGLLGGWGCGGYGSFGWKARLHEQLGTLRGEPSSFLLARLFSSPSKLLLLQNCALMLTHLLPQSNPYPSIYNAFHDFVAHDLLHQQGLDLWRRYILFEVTLLRELGFGLDLSACALTGRRDNLAFLSPKTGRAACFEAGAPHQSKLFRLPAFFWNTTPDTTPRDIRDGIRIMDHFLFHYAFLPKHEAAHGPPSTPNTSPSTFHHAPRASGSFAATSVLPLSYHSKPMKVWRQLRSPLEQLLPNETST